MGPGSALHNGTDIGKERNEGQRNGDNGEELFIEHGAFADLVSPLHGTRGLGERSLMPVLETRIRSHRFPVRIPPHARPRPAHDTSHPPHSA